MDAAVMASSRTLGHSGIRVSAQENARAMQFGPLAPEQMMEIEMLLRR